MNFPPSVNTAPPLSPLDGALALLAILALAIAYSADTQLYRFTQANKALIAAGKPPVAVLNTGLWHYRYVFV